MSRSSSRSSQTLYVGNLPDDIREREVEYLFYKYGPIVDINLKIPPRPPGYAFIEFVDARDAEDAISGRDGYNFDGHILRVELAHDGRGQSSTYDRHNSYSGGGGGRDGISRRSNYRVLVTGLPSSASWQDLKDHMRRAGDVCFSQVFRENGGTTGIVDYTNYDDMKYAIRKLDDSEFRNAFSRAYIMVKEYSRRSLSRFNSRSRSPTCSYSRSRSPIKSSHAKPSTRSVSRSRSVSSGSKDRSLSRLYRSKIGFMRARCPRPFLSVRAFLLRCIVLYLHSFVISCLSLHHEKIIDIKTMNVGEELERETLPLNICQRVYRISGLRDSGWYEVKVSYPASIPASFSLQVKSDEPALWLNKNRRLLNTEKTIFKSDSNNWNSGDNETYVLVTVEPAGVVAKPRVLERELVLFNIVCDELAFGIPHKAWWVGSAAVLCLILAAIIPYFFPSHLMLKIQHSKPNDPGVSKAS